MNALKKIVTLLCLILITLSNPTKCDAREYCTDTGGCAYEEAYQACCIAPAVVFAVALIAGIIAVGVHNRHAHSHN